MEELKGKFKRFRDTLELDGHKEGDQILEELDELTEEIVKLFAIPVVVSGCSSCGCREYNYVEDGKVCAYCEEPL